LIFYIILLTILTVYLAGIVTKVTIWLHRWTSESHNFC